ncbi:hypothetical protein NPIL_6371 [Nephila pilipes]|uniref:Uncharacterized protein n=1 Tax=Nephila pilipes TaxID=299642 RepID=A0A8X6QB69_NEPPI|nr:hypothetical protein NPIL_6371 [Nephila pilipes]
MTEDCSVLKSEKDTLATEEMEKEVEKKNELLEEGSDDNLPPSSEDFETKTDVEKKLKEKEPEYNGNSECKAQERDSSPSKSKDGNNKADKENIIASDAEISNGNRLPENEASTASKEAASEEDALLAIAEPNSSTDIRSTSEANTEDDISIILEIGKNDEASIITESGKNDAASIITESGKNDAAGIITESGKNDAAGIITESGKNANPVESSPDVEAKPKDDSCTVPETMPNTDASDPGADSSNDEVCSSMEIGINAEDYFKIKTLVDSSDSSDTEENPSTNEACPTSSTNEKKRKRETSSDEDEDAQASAEKVSMSSMAKPAKKSYAE